MQEIKEIKFNIHDPESIVKAAKDANIPIERMWEMVNNFCRAVFHPPKSPK